MPDQPAYWFPAMRYGWGWGLPQKWQGWLVLAIFLVLVGAAIFVFPPEKHPIAFSIYIAVLVVLLLAICFAKGEPPRWRWGDDRSPK